MTPSFNQGEYLEHTILSVLSQDYPNVEYIIVDGGSNDGSPGVIKKYADRFAWWVSEPDKGQADAINKGLAIAKGEIVAWLNSDDVYRPGAIKQAVEALRQNPEAGLVYGNLESIDESGEIFHTIRYKQLGLEDLVRFRIIGQPTVFMRRKVLDQVGFLDTSFHLLFDHHLWLRIAQFAPLKFVPAVWAAARRHPAAKNVARAADFSGEAFRILKWAGSEPGLAKIIAAHPPKVKAGAFRLSARYLSEGGKPLAALRAYFAAFMYWPPETLRQWRRLLFSFFQLLRVDFLIAKSGIRTRAKKNPMLVTGLHRSGTSWVGRMLEAGGGLAYVSEPLNVLHRPGVFGAPVQHWYTYICAENQAPYLKFFKETLSLDYRFFAELKSLRSVKDFMRMVRDSLAFALGRIKGSRVLLKDPFALFSIEWFAQQLNCTVLIVIRHPAAFVSSLKRLGWRFDFQDLLSQPLLMRDWLGPFREQMMEMTRNPDDVLEQASLLWRISVYFLSELHGKHPEFLVLRHEDLARRPLKQFDSIYSRLGLNFDSKAKRRIERATRSGNPTEASSRSIYSTTLDSAANVHIWKDRLSPNEIERIREVTGDVAAPYYSNEDWN